MRSLSLSHPFSTETYLRVEQKKVVNKNHTSTLYHVIVTSSAPLSAPFLPLLSTDLLCKTEPHDLFLRETTVPFESTP